MGKALNRKYKEIGARIASLRILAGITREEFCRRYSINEYTLQSWELGRNKMRKLAAEKLCIALETEKDIICTVEWIYQGKGLSPYSRTTKTNNDELTTKKEDVAAQEMDQQMILRCEIDFFERLHALNHPITVALEDKSMQPVYAKGDYLGGLPIPGECVENFHGEVCIIETSPKVYIIRRFVKSKDCFVLVPFNNEFDVITVESIKGIYEIIWHRKNPQNSKIVYLPDAPKIKK